MNNREINLEQKNAETLKELDLLRQNYENLIDVSGHKQRSSISHYCVYYVLIYRKDSPQGVRKWLNLKQC